MDLREYSSIEALPYANGCLLFVGWALRLEQSLGGMS